MPRFCFAWVNSNETTFGVEHHVVDEDIQSLEFSHEEAGIPTLNISVRNPLIGVLSPGRKTWAWLSWDDGSTVTPKFFGQIASTPDNIIGEVITYVLVAKPLDYNEQKATLANAMKVLPNYDEVFVDEAQRDDPDTVLEGYSELWHVDPVTHEVTTSDILTGEDGLEVFTEDEVPYDSVSITIGQKPNPSVSMDAGVTWTQQAAGTVELPTKTFESYTGDGIISDWPKPLASLGGGWFVVASTATDDRNIANAQTMTWSSNWENQNKEHANGDSLSIQMSVTRALLAGPSLTAVLTLKDQPGVLDPYADPQVNIAASYQITRMHVPLWKVTTTLSLRYEASRQRSERVKFTLSADIQPLLSSDTSEVVKIEKNGVDVGFGDDPPIDDVSRRSYFPTDRGLQSLEYLINVARAHLLLSSRVVQVTFNCRMERALGLSCRMNARLYDRRLPGGSVLGKIVGYQIKADGPSGVIIGTVTIACAIGYGNAVSETAGTPDYVEEGVLEPGIQHYTGDVVVLSAGDVGYSTPIDGATDDGLVFPLTPGQAVYSEQTFGSIEEQKAAIIHGFMGEILDANPEGTFSAGAMQALQDTSEANNRNVSEAMKNNPYWYELQLNPLTNGPFDVEYNVTVTDLMVPKQVDLAA